MLKLVDTACGSPSIVKNCGNRRLRGGARGPFKARRVRRMLARVTGGKGPPHGFDAFQTGDLAIPFEGRVEGVEPGWPEWAWLRSFGIRLCQGMQSHASTQVGMCVLWVRACLGVVIALSSLYTGLKVQPIFADKQT